LLANYLLTKKSCKISMLRLLGVMAGVGLDPANLGILRKMAPGSMPLYQSDKSGPEKGLSDSGNEKFPLRGRQRLEDLKRMLIRKQLAILY
jgi:hypothetical protein